MLHSPDSISLVLSGPFEGGGGYTLFAHARNIPNTSWNRDTLVISPCHVTFRSVARLAFAQWQN